MIPLPSALYLYVAVAIGAAAAGGTTAWTAQKWRYTGQIATIKAAQLEAVNTATREARATESRRFVNVHEAQNAATKRASAARADASAARTELDRLRDAIRARPVCNVPGDTASASTERSDPAGVVLAECGQALTDLARKADGHAGDALMMQSAWPK